jgi:hypothetical protein
MRVGKSNKQAEDTQAALIPAERIERSILLMRGQKVMLDRDLAELYGVETRVLVQAVKRNIRRFPADPWKTACFAIRAAQNPAQLAAKPRDLTRIW